MQQAYARNNIATNALTSKRIAKSSYTCMQLLIILQGIHFCPTKVCYEGLGIHKAAGISVVKLFNITLR